MAGIFQRFKNYFSSNKEERSTSVGWANLFNGITSTTYSNESVNADSAMGLSAVYACVRVIAETVSSLPLNLYERDGNNRTLDGSNPLYFMMHSEPNPYMSKYVFMEAWIATLLLYGNAYALINRDARGNPTSLSMVHPDNVSVESIGEWYGFRIKGIDGNIDSSDMLHIPDLTFDGIVGQSRISALRETIGLGLAAQKYGAQFFGSGAKISGTLSHPGKLGPDALQSLMQTWSQAYQGNGPFKTAILEEGMQYKPISLPPDQAQFIQTQKMNVIEIARAYRVPPSKIGDLDRATFSNIEHQSMSFYTDCIRPLCTKLEQEFNRKLLFENDKGRKYFEFNLNGLLRGDAKTRGEYYKSLFNVGAMSQNEIRAKENLNSVGPLGDKLYVPLNMSAIDEVRDEQE